MKIVFERTECSRCGGSGHYSYNQTDGTMCYGCSGSGLKLSKAGGKAHKAYEEAMKIPAGEVTPGMVLMIRGMGKTVRREVVSIGPSSTKSTMNGVEMYLLDIELKDQHYHIAAEGILSLALSPITVDRALASIEGMKGVEVVD